MILHPIAGLHQHIVEYRHGDGGNDIPQTQGKRKPLHPALQILNDPGNQMKGVTDQKQQRQQKCKTITHKLRIIQGVVIRRSPFAPDDEQENDQRDKIEDTESRFSYSGPEGLVIFSPDCSHGQAHGVLIAKCNL